MLKIAVATSDGINIDLHFGQTTLFHIFDVNEDGTYQLIEQRGIIPRATGESEEEHPAATTIEQLTDIDVVLVNRIGVGPNNELAARGIRAFSLDGTLDRALTAYGKRHKLFMKRSPGVSLPQELVHSGCGGCRSQGSCR
jgi:nitrogen fixation protein NifB